MSYPSHLDYGVYGHRASSYPLSPTSSVEATPVPPYFDGKLTNEPSSYISGGHHHHHDSPRSTSNNSNYMGGFFVSGRDVDHRVSHGSEKVHSWPTSARNSSPSYGAQGGHHYDSLPSTYPGAPGALPPDYSNPPPYPTSTAPSLASTSSSSDSGITADDVRPGDLKFTMIRWGIFELKTCKEIFASWATELDQCKNRQNNELEKRLVARVYELRDEAAVALDSSHQVLNSYRSFARCMDKNLRKLSQEGGQLYAGSDMQKLGTEVSSHSEALSLHVATMQEKLLDLVDMLDMTKRDSNKHKLWKKIWGWLVKAFQILAAVLTASAVIVPFVHPVGIAASAVMAGLTKLTSYTALLCEDFHRHASQEVVFDKVVDLLRCKVPEAAKKAELALSTFQTCQHVLRVGLEVEKGLRNGWMDSTEAMAAAKDWAYACDELHNFVDAPAKSFTI